MLTPLFFEPFCYAAYNEDMSGVIVKSRRQRAVKALRLTLAAVNHLLWPAVCANCSQHIPQGSDVLCSDCWQDLMSCAAGDYCPRCGRDVSRYALVEGRCADCADTVLHFDRLARVGMYDGTLRNLVLAFKNDRTELTTVLASLLNSALDGSGFAGEIDMFVPVPLHWLRRIIRGYNQSLALAMQLRHPSVMVSTDLARIRYTKQQPAMATAAARAKNVRDAFAVRRGHQFAGKRICLVDDIKTTGATLNECAKTLKQAGAARVSALVLAVAGAGIHG